MTIPELAKLAYAAYGESSRGLNFLGESMPSWERLPSATRDHWCAAAEAIVGAIREEANRGPRRGQVIVVTSLDSTPAVFDSLAEYLGVNRDAPSKRDPRS